MILEYLPLKYRTNKQYVLEAVNNNGCALEFKDNSVVFNREEALQIVKKHGFCLEHLSEEFQADKEIVIAAISNSDFAIEFASEALQEDEEILAILELEWAPNKIIIEKIWLILFSQAQPLDPSTKPAFFFGYK